MKKIKITVIPL